MGNKVKDLLSITEEDCGGDVETSQYTGNCEASRILINQ